jgi:beta-lactamase class A
VGAENVMATLRRLGIRNMQVRRGVEDGKAYRLGLNNQTDAFDMMLALQALAEKRAASPTACDSMLAVLQRQKFRDGIPAGLPKGTITANKTGSITAIAHDCAVVFPPVAQKNSLAARKPYLLVVLTSGIQDEKAANRLIAAISQKIYHDLILPL